ncbi:hypothetical protein B0T10DRAFT_125919 [Thelonectria olida]|uniref:Uncharacterized protein n=1 Tax=Thelonectria olida TaxID=1576542 RepID=A0A9P9AT58_9HYPO|nr:hypothetical protein B0T10DRAFT_125919 [Thelonectria olida]
MYLYPSSSQLSRYVDTSAGTENGLHPTSSIALHRPILVPSWLSSPPPLHINLHLHTLSLPPPTNHHDSPSESPVRCSNCSLLCSALLCFAQLCFVVGGGRWLWVEHQHSHTYLSSPSTHKQFKIMDTPTQAAAASKISHRPLQPQLQSAP